MFEVDIVHSLSTLPATDLNYKSCLEMATEDEIKLAIIHMKEDGGKHKGRIQACARELRRRMKSN